MEINETRCQSPNFDINGEAKDQTIGEEGIDEVVIVVDSFLIHATS